ncbi:MAG TPA: hypothetical protein VJK72_00735 [Candidatus Nanoarchaeia archaeon]|nr:hypothetical protein [Candidatus Nanoarchaeia archaeon]
MSIDWCKKHGMKLIEPNDNLSEEYYTNAEETLRVTNLIKNSGSNMWLATQKYYTEYLAAYSLLMKIGIKWLLENEKIIDFEFGKILEEDKELRIDNQYYLKNKPVHFDSKELSDTLLKIRKILDTIKDSDIKRIRKLI